MDPDDVTASVTVELRGEIDIAIASEVRQQLRAAIDGNPGALVIVDLSLVEFLDSSGLGALVGAHRYAHENGAALQVRAAQPNVAKVFKITGVDRIFDLRT